MPTLPDKPIAPNLAVDAAGAVGDRAVHPITDEALGLGMGGPVAELGSQAFSVATYEQYDDRYRAKLRSAETSYRDELDRLSDGQLIQRAQQVGNLSKEDGAVDWVNDGTRQTLQYRLAPDPHSVGGGSPTSPIKPEYAYSSAKDMRVKLKDLATPSWQRFFPYTSETRTGAELEAAIVAEQSKSSPDQNVIGRLMQTKVAIDNWESSLRYFFPHDAAARSDMDAARKFNLVVKAMHGDRNLVVTADREQRAKARVTSEASAFELSRKRLPRLQARRLALEHRLRDERRSFRRDATGADDISGLATSDADLLRAVGMDVKGQIGTQGELEQISARVAKLENRKGAGITSDEMAVEVASRLKFLRRREDASSLRHTGFMETQDAQALIAEMVPTLRAGGRILLMGEAGVAKTSILRYLVAQGYLGTPREVVTVRFNKQLTDQELMGGTELVAEGDQGAMKTEFIADGILKGASEGLPTILDEINTSDPGLIKLINDVLTAKPGRVIGYRGKSFTVKEGFCVVATGNIGAVNEVSQRFGGTQKLSDELLDRFDKRIRVQHPDLEVGSNYWTPGTQIRYPIDLLRFAAAKFTNDEGVFEPSIDARTAGISTDDLVKFTLLTHALHELSAKTKGRLQTESPELFHELTAGGVADGFARKDEVDGAEDSDTILRSGVLSPRTFDRILDSIRREKAGHAGVEKALQALVDGLTEESDRYTVEQVCKSFGYLGGVARRNDFTMPDLYPEIDVEVQTAYTEAKERQRQLGDAAAVAAEAAARAALLPAWEGYIGSATREQLAKVQLEEARRGWNNLSAVLQPGLLPNSVDALVSQAGSPERVENFARQVDRLLEARSAIIGSAAKTESGASVGEKMSIVLMPVAAMLSAAQNGRLAAWINDTRNSYVPGSRPRFRLGTREMVTPNGSGEYDKIYANPDGSGGQVDVVQYLTALQDKYGNWAPILASDPRDPIATDPTQHTLDDFKNLELGGAKVTGGGILELIAQTLQSKEDIGGTRLALVGNRLPGGNGVVLDRHATDGFAVITASSSGLFSQPTAPYLVLAA